MEAREALPWRHVVKGLLCALSQWAHIESGLFHLAAAPNGVLSCRTTSTLESYKTSSSDPVGTSTNPQAYTAAFEGIEMTTSLLEGG